MSPKAISRILRHRVIEVGPPSLGYDVSIELPQQGEWTTGFVEQNRGPGAPYPKLFYSSLGVSIADWAGFRPAARRAMGDRVYVRDRQRRRRRRAGALSFRRP